MKYTDETDKAYGLAGMAISLVAWDAEELLSRLDIDAPVEEAIRLSPDFYLTSAGRPGAKAAWEMAVKRFRLTVAMVVANTTCRAIALKKRASITADDDSAMRRLLTEEGNVIASLDADEVTQIYAQALTHCTRIFRHPGVCGLAETLATKLVEERNLSSLEVYEILAPINKM